MAFSPHNPHPTHPSVTCATGSTFKGSLEGLTVSVGHPESLMQEWSPVQVSSSTPYLTLTYLFFNFKACKAISKATLPLLIKIADQGYKKTLIENKNYLAGLNVHKGKITFKGVAEAFNLDYVPANKALLD